MEWQPNLAISTNKNLDFVFQRDGVLQNLGNTTISFSPNLIVGNRIAYVPNDTFQMALLTKYVGKQYMGNIDAESSVLKAYSQTDFNISYQIKPKAIFKSIVFSGLVNNIFDARYVSNGYFFTFDDTFTTPGTTTTIEGAGYYPQAGINFLLGVKIQL